MDAADLLPTATATVRGCDALGIREGRDLAAVVARVEALREETRRAAASCEQVREAVGAAERGYSAARNDAAWKRVEKARAELDKVQLCERGARADLEAAELDLHAAVRRAVVAEISAARAARARALAPIVARMANAAREFSVAFRELSREAEAPYPPRGLSQRASVAGVPTIAAFPLRLVAADAAQIGFVISGLADSLCVATARALDAGDDDAAALHEALAALGFNASFAPQPRIASPSKAA